MRVVQVAAGFGLEQVTVAERPWPTPGPGQVLVRMRAASLNYRDLLTVQGHYNPRQPLPLIPCSDGCGVIEAVGDGVDAPTIGTRVATCFAQGWLAGRATREKLRSTLGGPLDGSLAEAMVLPAYGVIPVPEHLTDEQAACLPCAALTAWSALVTQGGLQAGQTVLIQGTGGVSVFALQFAAMHGARPIVISSSDEKLERVRQMGAWRTLNYRAQPRWSKIVREWTDGIGVDHIVEVGGAGTLQQSIDTIAFGGQISLIGVLSGLQGEFNIVKLLMQNIRVQGVLVGHRDGFAAMNRAIGHTAMRPIVDRVFALEESRLALETLGSGSHFGKICVRFAGA